MAAENLEKKAAEMGVKLKAETQGSAGAKNILTADEIAHCKGIVIAADKNVDLARFDGKPVYSTNVSAGINDPEKLINIVLNGEAPVYHNAGGASASAAAVEDESTWHKIYKHLMNGVSHMLPFVIGGGILTAIAFLVDQPGLGTAAYGSSIPAAALFKTIGGEAFGLMLPILAGYIASSIADRPGLAPASSAVFLPRRATTRLSGHARRRRARLRRLHRRALRRLCRGLPDPRHREALRQAPELLEGIKPMLIYPVLGTLAIGVVMLALNPVFAAINTALNGFLAGLGTSNIVVLGLVLGGMMSVDMGGPFNKAAYALRHRHP